MSSPSPSGQYAVAYKSATDSHPGYRVRVNPADHKKIMWESGAAVSDLPVITTLAELESLPYDKRVAIPKGFAEQVLGWSS